MALTLKDLLMEIILHISKFLYQADVLNLACTSKHFYSYLFEYMWESVRIELDFSHELFHKNKLTNLKYTRKLHFNGLRCWKTSKNQKLLTENYKFLLDQCCNVKLSSMVVHDLYDELFEMTCNSLCNLKELTLRCCDISSSCWISLQILYKLESLSLRCCWIREPALSPIAQLPHLKQLTLWCVFGLSEDMLKPLCSMTTLKKLSISLQDDHKAIERGGIDKFSIKSKHFINNLYLEELVLEDSRTCCDETVLGISSLRSLTKLFLKRCDEMTDAALLSISEMVWLQVLHLKSNDFMDAAFSYLMALTSLKDLNIQWSRKLTHVGFSYICEIKSLVSLNITGCHQLRDDDFKLVNNLVNLKSFTIKRNLHELTLI